MTKKQLQQKRRYQKRKQLLDQLLYEQPQSLKANTFVPIDSRHKLTRFHKAETVETFKAKIENAYTTNLPNFLTLKSM